MEPRKITLNASHSDTKARKPRFQIVKLEERIAPRFGRYHYNNGSGGHCGHGGCK